MKFKNLITGSIVEATNEFVIEQLKKSASFEEVKVQEKLPNKKEKNK